MRVALVVGLLFLAGALYNLFGPEHNIAEALAGLATASILIGLFFFVRSERRQEGAFLRWISENGVAISGGGARYRNVLITPQTKLTRYVAVLSFLVVTFRVPSRLYIVGHDATPLIATTFTVISVLLGWWGIPWGPVYTVRAIWKNILGGEIQEVAALSQPAMKSVPGAKVNG